MKSDMDKDGLVCGKAISGSEKQYVEFSCEVQRRESEKYSLSSIVLLALVAQKDNSHV